MTELDTLNELLADLENSSDAAAPYVREHLEGARYYVTGAMPDELELNLRLAEESLDSLSDDGLKSRVRQFLQTHR